MGRARPRNDLAGHASGRRAGARRRRHSRRPTWRRSASPTSAKRPCCGSAAPAGRSRTPSSGRTGAPPAAAPNSARAHRDGPGQDRPGHRPLFLGDQNRLAARPRRWPAGPCRPRRDRLRHHRLLADLETHRRPTARHRRDQRQPNDAARYRRRRLGRRSARTVRRTATGAAGVAAELAGVRRKRTRRRFSARPFRSARPWAISRRRCSPRPVSRQDRQRTLTALALSCWSTPAVAPTRTTRRCCAPSRTKLATSRWRTRWRGRSWRPAARCNGCATSWV